MRADWHGAGSDEPIHDLIDEFMAASDGRIGGFQDVVAFWDDGRISLQELEDLLGCPVDVMEAENLHPLIRSQILEQALAL